MNDKQIRNLASIECCGENYFYGALTVDERSLEGLSQDEITELCWEHRDVLEKLREAIAQKLTEKNKGHLRQETLDKYMSCIENAGLTCSWYEIIKHGYSSSSWYWVSPWIKAYTNIGPLTIGWRKRVIVLDWEETPIEINAHHLFSKESATKDGKMIHCWSYEKLQEYLTELHNHQKS